MDEDEMIVENDEEVLEVNELPEEDEDVIELDDITDDSEDEEESEDDIVESEDDSETEQDEIDYKALYEAEQKKRKDLQSALNSERKQRKQSTNKSNNDITATETYKDLISKNIDSDVAEVIAKSIEKRSQDTYSQIEDLKFEAAIAKTSKKSEFKDIEEYAEDIRPFVDKGLTIEQAYYVAVGEKGKTNTKAEIERQIEAKMKNQKAKNKIQRIDTTGGSGSIKSTEKYSAMDIKMAKAFGMSAKEYADYKKISSEKDYQKMKSKRKD